MLIFSFLLVCMVNCSSGGSVPTSPESTLELFTGAAGADDAVKAETLFTKECWTAKRDSGNRFFKQAVRKKFDMEKKDVKSKGDKAVVTADILREGKVVDKLFFYMIRQNDKWLIDGIDEIDNHVGYYLDGILPARFDILKYPGNKELETLGAKLIEIAGPLKAAESDPAKQAELLKGVFYGDPGTLFSGLRLLRQVGDLKLRVAGTYWVEPIKRAAIKIFDESEKEKVFIYAAKEADGWKLVNCYTGWLSAEAILR
jgi:hypothetical protein